MFQPLTEALIMEADLTEGEAVLDVAGGRENLLLQSRRRFWANGSVTYTELCGNGDRS